MAKDFTSKIEVKISAFEVKIRAYEVKSCAYEVKIRAYEVKIGAYEVKIRACEVKIGAYEVKSWAQKSRHRSLHREVKFWAHRAEGYDPVCFVWEENTLKVEVFACAYFQNKRNWFKVKLSILGESFSRQNKQNYRNVPLQNL